MKTNKLHTQAWFDLIEDRQFKTFPTKNIATSLCYKMILSQKSSANQLAYQLTLTQRTLT